LRIETVAPPAIRSAMPRAMPYMPSVPMKEGTLSLATRRPLIRPGIGVDDGEAGADGDRRHGLAGEVGIGGDDAVIADLGRVLGDGDVDQAVLDVVDDRGAARRRR
jgi:hypothetical protein